MTPTAATPKPKPIFGARVKDQGDAPLKWKGQWHRVLTHDNPNGEWGSKKNAQLVLQHALDNDHDLVGHVFEIDAPRPEPTLETIVIDDWLLGNVVPIKSVPTKYRAAYSDTLRRAALAAFRYGFPVHVDESFRTLAQQEHFYAIYLAGGALAAKPGMSMHEKGLALDIVNARTTPKLIVELRKLELIDDVPVEIWHVTNHHHV